MGKPRSRCVLKIIPTAYSCYNLGSFWLVKLGFNTVPCCVHTVANPPIIAASREGASKVQDAAVRQVLRLRLLSVRTALPVHPYDEEGTV